MGELQEIESNSVHERNLVKGTSSLQFINWHTLGKRLLAGCLLRALRRLIGIHFIFYYGTSFFAAFGIKQSFVAASGGFCWRYAVFVWFLNLRDEGAWFGGRG